MTAGLYAGESLLGDGLGYDAGCRKHAPRRDGRITLLLSPRLVGLGVGDRF